MSTPIILAILATLVLLMVLTMHRYRKKTDGTPDEIEPCIAGGGCCGGKNCHRKQGTAHTDSQALYFEDEELDRFRGRGAADYTPEEVAEWQEVVTTLRASEMMDWVTGIHRRQLHIPGVLQETVSRRLKESRPTP